MKPILTFLFFWIALLQYQLKAQNPSKTSFVDTVKVDKKVPNVTHPSIKYLQTDIYDILQAPELANATVGISIQNVESGESFYKINPNTSLIPASTLKLFTTAAALDALGPDFRFTTRLYIQGIIKPSGELDGNIIVRASGDPTMSVFFYKDPLIIMDNIALALDSIGVKSIKGNIIIDYSYFDNQEYGPGWAIDDITFPYSAPVSAISFYDNKVDVSIKPALKVGDVARLTQSPENHFVRIVNNVITAEPGSPTIIYSEKDQRSSVIDIHGAISNPSMDDKASGKIADKQYTLGVAVDNPSQYFLHLLRMRLEKMGIRIRGTLLDNEHLDDPIDYMGLQVFYSIVSPPLADIIKVINKHSHNLAAEMLFKTIAKENTGEGSYEKAAEYMRKFIARMGIMPENCSIVDGSGLSRLNLMSAQQQTTLLSTIYRSSMRDSFYASLAVPGEKGTLSNRLTKSLAEKHVHAKTGSMNNVSCLSGYITTRDNEVLACSIMINGFTVPDSIIQNIQDIICMRLASFSRK